MKHLKIHSLIVMLIVVILALWGCPKQSDVTSSSETQKQGATSANKASSKKETSSKNESMKEGSGRTSMGLKPIYFDSGKSFIRNDEKAIMKANADWLKANPKIKISIEGNCDERGTKEYNKALGKRRSTSARKYLEDLGISANRLSVISHGAEKPVCTEHNEACWQKNSRVDFVVVK